MSLNIRDDSNIAAFVSNGVEILTPKEEAQTLDESRPNRFLRAVLAGCTLLICLLLLLFAVEFSTLPNQQIGKRQAAAAAVPDETPSAFRGLVLQAKAAYVSDLPSGKVLFQLNPNAQLPLASVTKIPLILVISDVLARSDTVVIPREAVMRGEGGGLGTGDTWNVGELIDFTLLASSNAGAEALADAADEKLRSKYPDAPESHAAVWRMNELAKDLGLSKTYFLNPSGLDESDTQPGSVSSARDVAILFTYASRADRMLFASTVKNGLSLGPLNGKSKPTENTNEALPDIPGLVMGKTGYTDLAGGNLAIVFEATPGRPVVAVVLGSTHDGRFADMKKIVDAVRASEGENQVIQ